MKSFLFLLLFIMSVLSGYAQSDDIIISKINKTGINYKSFEISNDKLFAISDSGNLIIWDLKTLDTIHFPHNSQSFRYTAITKDRNNQIFIGSNSGNVYKVNPFNLSYSLFLKDKYYINSICFNSKNKMFLIIPDAVYEPISKKKWRNFKHQLSGLVHEKKVLGLFRVKTNTFFSLPQYTTIDSLDRIWMSEDHGEFGTRVQIFDTRKCIEINEKFDSVNLSHLTMHSVFSDNRGNIYLTSGFQYFYNRGNIYKIDSFKKATRIYNSEDYRDKGKNEEDDYGIFVGPGTYNYFDSCIYFASSNGFYKARLPLIGKIQNPQLVFNPDLTWPNERLAIGVGMVIKKIEFTPDNKMVFLTTNDGICLFYNNKLIYLL